MTESILVYHINGYDRKYWRTMAKTETINLTENS